jgi:hypothetical protein
MGSADLGAPTSYLVLAAGTPVYAAGGERIGNVTHVLAVEEKDIFDGLVVRIDTRHAFVDASQVSTLHERGVVLNIDAAEVARLPEPGASPGALSAGPDETVPGGLSEKLRRAWDLISGRY